MKIKITFNTDVRLIGFLGDVNSAPIETVFKAEKTYIFTIQSVKQDAFGKFHNLLSEDGTYYPEVRVIGNMLIKEIFDEHYMTPIELQ